MKVNTRKTYLLKFKNIDSYLQFFIESNNKAYKHIGFKAFLFKAKYICILKIPSSIEYILPHLKEYGSIKQINKLDEAYYKEYGKIIKP